MRGSPGAGFERLPRRPRIIPTSRCTFITPAAAGNSPDVVTRIVADKLTQLWKQQIVVINRPGAGGLIAAQAAAALPKDGYSLYMTQASTWTVLPIQQEGKMPVDLHKAFAPVGMVGEQPIAVGVNKDVKANSVAELIELANGTKDGMLFAATNRGGQAHLTGELLRDKRQGQHVVRALPPARRCRSTTSSRAASRSCSRALPVWRRERRAAASGSLASRRRSGCPTCRTCRRSTRPCRASSRAAGS